jgi:hypothetical protein
MSNFPSREPANDPEATTERIIKADIALGQ